jgi:Rad3-related DNA helicase
LDYFRGLLGGEENDYTLRLGSPFPRENLCLIINDRIATRYKNRGDSYAPIAAQLEAMVSQKTGNYMVFFPSYAYLNEVYTKFSDAYPDIRTLVQEQEADEKERDLFLAEFTDKPMETLLAFVVLGGVFSEGIDLKGERLSGAAIVGVGLPMVCAERDGLLRYFNNEGRDGFSYAYIYPGMNKVMQAAGRVIRTETDRGLVMLIDTRCSENDYRGLFPAEWVGYGKVRDTERLNDALRNFWGDA